MRKSHTLSNAHANDNNSGDYLAWHQNVRHSTRTQHSYLCGNTLLSFHGFLTSPWTLPRQIVAKVTVVWADKCCKRSHNILCNWCLWCIKILRKKTILLQDIKFWLLWAIVWLKTKTFRAHHFCSAVNSQVLFCDCKFWRYIHLCVSRVGVGDLIGFRLWLILEGGGTIIFFWGESWRAVFYIVFCFQTSHELADPNQ